MTEIKKPRVILADDETHVRKMVKLALAKMNCEVIGEAANGQEAVDLFKKEKPDLLMLDINMPVKTGEEALAEIMDEFPDAFVIMLTSVAEGDSVEKCLDLGAANYILKSTPIKELQKMIKETWVEFKKGGQNG